MSSFKLYSPVWTLDNRLLLPAGTEITRERNEELISTNPEVSTHKSGFLEYATVRSDLEKFLSVENYRTVFSDKETVNTVFGELEHVKVIVPVLRMLDYFKRHDYYSYRHVLMVYALAILIARTLIPDAREWRPVVQIGPTHDFGKTSVPIDILTKDTPLTKAEKQVMNDHAAAGYVLIGYYNKDPECLSSVVARDHHERRDASGYPGGIELGDRIVEIVAACDVFDALLSPRPYRRVSYDKRTAIEVITDLAEEGKFSWDVVKALIAHNRKNKPNYKDVVTGTDKRGTPPEGNMYGKLAEDQ
jgi:HD-GYP domain-containing protein (c-di-GMP phosphodiesterase class II)